MDTPELGQSPVVSIQVTDAAIEYHLEAGSTVRTERSDRSVTGACGLAETSVWTVPVEVGLTMDDPVLVETVCPLSPASSIQLVVMERSHLPVLASLGAESDGESCAASSECVWFVPV